PTTSFSSSLVCSASGTGIGWSASERMMTTFAFVQQLGAGILIPALALWTMSHLRAEHRGRGMGIWTAAFFLGQFVSPLLVSIARGISGTMQGAFFISGLIGIAIAAATWFIVAPRQQPQAA
ncbi:MAG: MFS transporter, partial [Novosphingobium sp.]